MTKINYKFVATTNVSNRKIIYIDENDFRKKYKGLRRVSPKAFKYLCYEVFKKDLLENKDGKYQLNLPTVPEFKNIYGEIQLIYSVKEGIVIIEDLKPNDIFMANYMSDIKIYKGIPYSTEKDKFKIDMMIRMKGV